MLNMSPKPCNGPNKRWLSIIEMQIKVISERNLLKLNELCLVKKPTYCMSKANGLKKLLCSIALECKQQQLGVFSLSMNTKSYIVKKRTLGENNKKMYFRKVSELLRTEQILSKQNLSARTVKLYEH